jgi:multiple sugar transport system ATP-binding protein
VRIKLADDTEATLPLPRQDLAATPGGNVVLGIRPEHLFRYDPELRARKPGIATLKAPVELVEPTGAETMAMLKFGALEVVGRFDPDGAPRMGETLNLGIDMAHAHLFDPVTQAVI